MLSHYHEAAYDAHMTGVVFAHILKVKEGTKTQVALNLKGEYVESWLNKMMFDFFGS